MVAVHGPLTKIRAEQRKRVGRLTILCGREPKAQEVNREPWINKRKDLSRIGLQPS